MEQFVSLPIEVHTF